MSSSPLIFEWYFLPILELRILFSFTAVKILFPFPVAFIISDEESMSCSFFQCMKVKFNEWMAAAVVRPVWEGLCRSGDRISIHFQAQSQSENSLILSRPWGWGFFSIPARPTMAMDLHFCITAVVALAGSSDPPTEENGFTCLPGPAVYFCLESHGGNVSFLS